MKIIFLLVCLTACKSVSSSGNDAVVLSKGHGGGTDSWFKITTAGAGFSDLCFHTTSGQDDGLVLSTTPKTYFAILKQNKGLSSAGGLDQTYWTYTVTPADSRFVPNNRNLTFQVIEMSTMDAEVSSQPSHYLSIVNLPGSGKEKIDAVLNRSKVDSCM